MAASERVQKSIDTIKEERRRFEAFCRSLSDDELARPVPDSTWTVRDSLSHPATPDTESLRWRVGVAPGGPASPLCACSRRPSSGAL